MSEIEPMSPKSEFRWLAVILAIGLLARVMTVIVLDIQPESDSAEYRTMALNFIAGKGFVDSMGNLAMYNVGYPLFILAPTFTLLGNHLLPAQLVNALLGVASIILCYTIAREVGAGSIGRLLAPAFWALYLPSWVYAEYLAKENLMTPLMLGTIWCALRLAKRCSLGVTVICGVLFGLLALTGNSALSLAPAVVFAIVFAPANSGRKLFLSGVISVTALVVAAPWIMRNDHVLGAPVLNTNGGFNFYLGNNPAATGYFVSIAETPRGESWDALRKIGEVQASETLRREAVSWIKQHPSEFLALTFKKAALFWMPPFHEGKGPNSTMETLIRRLWLVQFVALALGAAGSVLLPSLRTRYVGVLWLSIASYTAVHMLFLVIFRYREPIMPVLCVLTALTVANLSTRLGRRAKSIG